MKDLYDSLRGYAKEEFKAVRRIKLLLQIYSLGLLNPDVEYFT